MFLLYFLLPVIYFRQNGLDTLTQKTSGRVLTAGSQFTYNVKSGLQKMPQHTHNFVENYQGLVGYGADRETDENTLIYYMQKFSDDRFISLMTKRMTDDEMLELFNLLNRLLKSHLTENEYHAHFLKDDH